MKKIFITIPFLLLTAGMLSAQTIEDSVLYIADGTTKIKSSAYYGKTDFNKVVIPSSVTEIDGLAFHSCSKLKEVEIPASVDTIGNAVFQNCTSLTKVTLHNGLKNMSYRLFKNTAISEITIPASVTEFGNEIFASCDSLTTIRVDKYTEAHAFFSADSRMQLTDNEPIQTKEQWLATAKNSILDDTVLYVGHGVTKINDNQYKDNQNITEIHFTETLERIGSYAFRKNTGLKKIVVPGNVKVIGEGAFSGCSNLEEVIIEEGVQDIKGYTFYGCKKLKSVTFPKSIQKLFTEGLFWETNSSILFHCYAGSQAYNLALKNNYLIDIIGVDEQYADSIDMKQLSLSGNKTVNAGLLRDLPIERVDLNNDIVEIGENAFNDNTKLRIKRGTYADEWAKTNGYYLCGVLADLNVYTKDKSKQIEEDFTRILCDNDSYIDWTSYKFQVQQLLKIEEVDDKIVLTSFLLEPCENVTVSQNGKAIISNKTIQPLTRTVLSETNGTTSPDDFSVSSDDSLYQTLTALSAVIDWTVSFNGNYIRTTDSGNKGVPYLPMYPVFCREWIATICNYAYVIASKEYEELCYNGVEEKWFVTNEDLTQFLTKEEMDALLAKTRTHTFLLGRCDGGGLGSLGSSGLWLLSSWFRNLGSKEPHGFFHEFSHNMGWNHNDGNMCNLGAGNGYGEKCWPMMATRIFKQFFAAGVLPYNDKSILNSDAFSYNELHKPDPAEDVITDSVLHIAEGVPCVASHKNQTDFTKVEMPESVELIKGSAFYGTKITEVDIPSSVKRIENLAFHSCADFKSVTIPDGVKKVGDAAFQNCTSLTSAEIGSGLRELNYRLFKGSGLTEITIPSNIKVIGKEAFQDCKNLKSVVIGDGVRKIDNSAFKNTAIEEIEIPASVTEIGTGITPKNTVWIVEKGSYAHKFAVENNMTFRIKNENGNGNQSENDNKNENEINTETSVTESVANVNIYAYDRTIVVENATDEIRVYDVMGRLVCRDVACRVRTEIPMEKSGVYIVKVGNLSKKVIVE